MRDQLDRINCTAHPESSPVYPEHAEEVLCAGVSDGDALSNQSN